MASFFDGEVTRTWKIQDTHGKEHTISLYHDALSGVRCAMLDYEEISGSMGSTSILSASGRTGDLIHFIVDRKPGYLQIRKEGLFGFEYYCVYDHQEIIENTRCLEDQDGGVAFSVDVTSVVTVPDISPLLTHLTSSTTTTTTASSTTDLEMITFYEVRSTRLTDGVTNTVHRRFRDFDHLREEVVAAFKGHHLASSIPDLPPKLLKWSVDHNDPAFIEERRHHLAAFLRRLIGLPHVSSFHAVHVFLGLNENVKEYTHLFRGQKLGLSLVPTRQRTDATIAVSFVDQNNTLHSPVQVGDVVSRLNGSSVASLPFEVFIAKLKLVSHRPLLLHFIHIDIDTNEENVILVTQDDPFYLQEEERGKEEEEEEEQVYVYNPTNTSTSNSGYSTSSISQQPQQTQSHRYPVREESKSETVQREEKPKAKKPKAKVVPLWHDSTMDPSTSSGGSTDNIFGEEKRTKRKIKI